MLVETVYGDGANVYDLYDGTLQPFSYSELQATVTSTATPSFIPPETLNRAPEAFPFDMPPLPSDFGNHVQAPAQQPPDHGYNGNPYDSDEYAQNMKTMRDWSSHKAVLERALHTDPRGGPATFVEAGSIISAPTVGVAASESVAEGNDPILAAAKTTPIPDSGVQPSSQDFGDTFSPDADLALRDSVPNSLSVPAPSLPATSSIPPPPRFAAKQSAASSVTTPSGSSPSTPSSYSGSGSGPTTGSAPASGSTSSSSSSSTPDQSSVSESSESDESSHESGPTPISAPPKPLHPCVPTGNKKTCRIAFDSNTIPWRVVTVPRLESQSSSSSSSASSSSHGGSSSSESSEDSTGIQEEYSSNPSIARAQRAYYSKLKELVKEKRWMAEVSRIIEEYNFKIRNVNKHAAATERELRKSRKDIVDMIKSEKQAKLQKELEAALESLQKLEATSQALTGKMQELTQTKLGLKQTISKIQRVIGSGGGGSAGSMLELQEVVKPTADEQQYADKVAANESAKKLFGSLLELVGKAGLHGRLANKQRLRRPTISIDLDRAREEEEQESVGPADDLSSISSRAAAIAAKYAKEENDHLHTNLPLRTLSVREYKKSSDDDLFLD